MKISNYQYLPSNEKWNVITHFTGFVIALCCLPILFGFYQVENQPLFRWIGVGTFSLGLLLTYLASSLYHLALEENTKNNLRILDHIAIYFLIGGSYTAYFMKYFNTSIGINFLIVHWVIILFGIIFKLFYCGKYEIFSTLLYVVLGWMALVVIEPLRANIPIEIQLWILAGGIAYSLGVIFYLWTKYKFNHVIWHCFVILGTAIHFIGLCY